MLDVPINKKLFIVLLLGFSSGLPLALVGSTLQAWYAEAGLSILSTGLLSLLGIPYVIRTLWGPILDNYTLFRLGKRRSWILSMQILLALGFNVMAWMSPAHAAGWLAAIACCVALLSATQDMAIEAHRTEFFAVNELALGATFAVFGHRIAMLFSSGLALILAYYYGFPVAYRTMGGLMVIGMLATWLSYEPSTPSIEKSSMKDAFILPVKQLALRPQIMAFMGFVLCYKLGEVFTSTTSGIVMPFLIQGLGFSLDTIGYVNKIIGVAAILVGGFLAGVLLLRWSLYRALFWFGILQAICNSLFVVLAIAGKNLTILAIAVIFDNLATGMGTTALVALIMRYVDKRFTATQFSILITLTTLPRVFSGVIAAVIQSWIGWVGLFQCSVIFALLFIPFLHSIRQQIFDYNKEESLTIPV